MHQASAAHANKYPTLKISVWEPGVPSTDLNFLSFLAGYGAVTEIPTNLPLFFVSTQTQQTQDLWVITQQTHYGAYLMNPVYLRPE